MDKFKLRYKPWVGENYEASKYGKLLLLGESHYLNSDKDGSTYTSQVVREAIKSQSGMYTSFFRTIELIFDRANDHEVFWHEIAFANLIQTGLVTSNSQPTEEERSSIAPAFYHLLQLLQPNYVIVCSKRMWNNWIPAGNGSEVKKFSVENKLLEIWHYQYPGGHCLVTGINHPSRIWGQSYKIWRKLVQKFLAFQKPS